MAGRQFCTILSVELLVLVIHFLMTVMKLVTKNWNYTVRQRERVACGECGTVIAAGSMSSHLMT